MGTLCTVAMSHSHVAPGTSCWPAGSRAGEPISPAAPFPLLLQVGALGRGQAGEEGLALTSRHGATPSSTV